MLFYRQSHFILKWLMLMTVYVSFASADIMVFSTISRNEIEQQFKDAPARFGGPIPPEGIRVFLSLKK